MSSWCAPQIFEAVGISPTVCQQCFTGVASRIGGFGYFQIAQSSLMRHEQGFPSRDIHELPVMQNPGDYHWRDGGERHVNDPGAVAALQAAVKLEGYAGTEAFAAYSVRSTPPAYPA